MELLKKLKLRKNCSGARLIYYLEFYFIMPKLHSRESRILIQRRAELEKMERHVKSHGSIYPKVTETATIRWLESAIEKKRFQRTQIIKGKEYAIYYDGRKHFKTGDLLVSVYRAEMPRGKKEHTGKMYKKLPDGTWVDVSNIFV